MILILKAEFLSSLNTFPFPSEIFEKSPDFDAENFDIILPSIVHNIITLFIPTVKVSFLINMNKLKKTAKDKLIKRRDYEKSLKIILLLLPLP